MCLENDIDIQYKIDDVYRDFIYCYDCLETLKERQWYDYIKGLKTDCQPSLTRLLEIGPPINYRDFSVENGKEIDRFLYKGNYLSARLKGSFDTMERDQFWADLKTNDIMMVLEKYNLN